MIHVMIVEDDPFWREQLCIDLNDEPDIEILIAVSAKEEALSFLLKKTVDVVLMDIELAENRLGGLEAAQMINRLTKGQTKVIMLTSFNESEIIIESFRKGAMNYISKTNYSDVVAAIRQAHEGNASIHADAADALLSELRLSVLTPMEREVLELREQGLTKPQIAEKLIKSVNTIKSHLRSIRDKLNK